MSTPETSEKVHCDLLLTGGTVITMDPQRRILQDGSVAVSGGRIACVGASVDVDRRVDATEVIDCRGTVILPGFVDAHAHAGHSLFKTVGVDTPSQWFDLATEAYFHHTTPDYWYADALLGAAEKLLAGVTCGISVLGSQPRSDDPEYARQHARGYLELGGRDIVAVGPSGLPWPSTSTTWVDGERVPTSVDLAEMIACTEQVVDACHGAGNGRIGVVVAPFTLMPSCGGSGPIADDRAPAPTRDDIEQAAAVRELADRRQLRIHTDAYGGMVRLAAQLGSGALLGPDVHLQHCVGITPEEVSILAETGTAASHAPGGRAPVPSMIAAGVPTAIASEGNSRRPFDLLQAARGAQTVQRVIHDDPFLLPAGKALEMITIEAAQVIGQDDRIGSIEETKCADLVVLEMRRPHLVPGWMPVHRLIFEAVGHDVRTVIVDGKIVVRDRELQNADVDEVMALADEEAHLLIDRSGMAVHLTPPGWRSGRTPVPVADPQLV